MQKSKDRAAEKTRNLECSKHTLCEALAMDRPGLDIFHNFPPKRRLTTLNEAIQSSISAINASNYLSIRDRTSKSDIDFVKSIHFMLYYRRMCNWVTHSISMKNTALTTSWRTCFVQYVTSVLEDATLVDRLKNLQYQDSERWAENDRSGVVHRKITLVPNFTDNGKAAAGIRSQKWGRLFKKVC